MIRTSDMLFSISQMGSPLLAVQGNRCVLVRHRKAQCLRCAAVCTSGAITQAEDGSIAVDPALCIGCGTCATVCPSGCLEPLNPTDEELFGQMANAVAETRDPLVLLCSNAAAMANNGVHGDDASGGLDASEVRSPSPAPDRPHLAPSVECLGRIDEAFLVEAVARGTRRIVLVCGDCAHCAHKSGGAVCDKVMASATDLLRAFGSSATIEKAAVQQAFIDNLLETPLQCGTADAQESAPGQGANTTPKPTVDDLSFQHVQADGTLPHFVPERRLRLFNSLKALGEPHQDAIETKLWGQVSVNTDICRSCRMCAVFCPTAAIAPYDKEDGTFGIRHRSALCMQCRLCESICPEHAITVASEVSLPEFMSGKQFRFEMDPIGWNPSAPDAISSRMARFFDTDAVQDPQATNKPAEMAARRAFAQKKQAAREAAREN